MTALHRLSSAIDLVSNGVGKVGSLLIPTLIVIVTADVILNIWAARTPWGYDVVSMAGGALFTLCGAYSMTQERDVRIDIFFERYPRKVKEAMNLVAVLGLFFPLFGLGLLRIAPWAWKSFQIREVTTWSYMYPIWQFKLLLVAGFILMLVQGISYVIRHYERLLEALREERAQRNPAGGGAP